MEESRSKTRVEILWALFRLLVPIMLQNLISAVVTTADAFMLSAVGRDALSASSLAGQVTFVLTLFYFGLSTGVSVLAAQYWGRKDTATIAKIQGLALRYSAAVSLLFFLAASLIPEALMRAFTAEPEIIRLGAVYLRMVSASYLAMGVSQMLLATMRSIEQTRLSAGISTACLLMNIALNACSIYILFPGRPIQALGGVAAATAIARVSELILCLLAVRRGKGVSSSLAECRGTEKWLSGDFWKCALPVQANYLIWGGGTAAVAAIIGHMGSDLVAANSLASALRSLVIVGCSALGTAGSILLGKTLGAGRFAEARRIGNQVFLWSLLLGAGAGALLMALRAPCLRLSALEGEAARLLREMLWVNAVYCVGKSFNAALVGGVFCAGGDTKFGLVCDAIAMWGVIIPLGCAAAFLWRLQPFQVYLLLCMDEFIKMPFVAAHYLRRRWIKNLTREEEARG